MKIKSMIITTLIVCSMILLTGIESFGEERPIFPNDSLTNQSVKVGDKVYVTSLSVYNQYHTYLENRNIDMDYWGNKDYEHNGINEESAKEKQKKNNKPEKNKLYTVMYVNYHDTLEDNVLSIIMDEEGYYFIIDINNLQLENGQQIISNDEGYLDRPFNSNIQCEVCEETDTELEIWYDSNNIKHYTCLEKCTNGLDILYGPNVREKDTIEENNNDNTSNDGIVYWTRGKSYHKSSSCYHYVNAKYHYKGSKSECPKYDPCDDCCY